MPSLLACLACARPAPPEPEARLPYHANRVPSFDHPAIESETDVEYVHRKARQARKTHVYTMGAITKKLEGVELAEMGFMAEAGAVGFTDDGHGVQNPAVMLRALKYAAMFNVVIAQHCQDDSIAGDGVMPAGKPAPQAITPEMQSRHCVAR